MFTQDNSPTFEIEVILNLRCHPLKFTQKGVTSSFKPKGTKATGPDQIPGHLLKQVGRLLNYPYSHFTIEHNNQPGICSFRLKKGIVVQILRREVNLALLTTDLFL